MVGIHVYRDYAYTYNIRHVHVRTCTCTYMYMYIYKCTCTFIYMYMYMYINVHARKSDCLGVLCCFALFVCLILLASFFLPSHLSFKNMYLSKIVIAYSMCIVHVHVCTCVYTV